MNKLLKHKHFKIYVTIIFIVIFSFAIITSPFWFSLPYGYLGSWGWLYLHSLGPVYLEIDYETGAEPDRGALTYLTEKFNEVSVRSLVIMWDMMDEFNETIILSEDASYLYLSSIREIRDSPNNPSFIYIIYIKEVYEINSELVIGGITAYSSIIAICEPSLVSDIAERNVLLHEMGHLLGLGHCNDPDCIMFSTVSTNKLVGFCNKCINKL